MYTDLHQHKITLNWNVLYTVKHVGDKVDSFYLHQKLLETFPALCFYQIAQNLKSSLETFNVQRDFTHPINNNTKESSLRQSKKDTVSSIHLRRKEIGNIFASFDN